MERSLFIVYEAIIRIRLGSMMKLKKIPLPLLCSRQSTASIFFLSPIASSISHHCCHQMVRLLIRPQRTQSYGRRKARAWNPWRRGRSSSSPSMTSASARVFAYSSSSSTFTTIALVCLILLPWRRPPSPSHSFD